MANIIAKTKYPFYDGMSITFKAPCDCSVVQGLTVMDPYSEKSFTFKDALGNTLTGFENIFSEAAYVNAVLDTTNNYAYLQNGETPGFGILKDDTKPLYGLDSTAAPDDVFKKIGLGGMNYVPTTVVDTPLFDKWELYPHLPIDPAKAAVRDFQYLEDAYYILTQNTAKSPYSFILWRSEDLVNWTQGATIRETTDSGHVQNSWRNRIFRVNGKFIAVINLRSYEDGTGTTYVHYSDSYDGTFSAASVSGKTRCKNPCLANGLLFMHSEKTTTPSLYVYDVTTNTHENDSFTGLTAPSVSAVIYHNGKYFLSYYGGVTSGGNRGRIYPVTVSSTSDGVTVEVGSTSCEYGGHFLPYGNELYVWCVHGTTSRYIYKVNEDDVSASTRVVECKANMNFYFHTIRDSQLWLALSTDPTEDGRGPGYYTPVDGDFSNFTLVRSDTQTNMSAFELEDSSDPWVITEDERIISYDMQMTETTYKVIPKIVDYLGKDILLPSAQLDSNVEIGSYTGTGTAGSSNPTTLTFNFEPKMVVIAHSTAADFNPGNTKANNWQFFIRGMTSATVKQAESNVSDTKLNITWDGNTLSFYHTYSTPWAGAQLNTSGATYLYIAI